MILLTILMHRSPYFVNTMIGNLYASKTVFYSKHIKLQNDILFVLKKSRVKVNTTKTSGFPSKSSQ